MKIRTSSHGFTLIELLVVIVIIGILAGISLPVFSRIMERGSVIQELSNLRQIGIASLAYMNDNDGYLGTASDPWNTKWAVILGGTTTAEGKYVQDISVFRSPFDTGAGDGRTEPISFGPNANVAAKNNSELWKKTSSLVFMGPTLTEPEKFVGTRETSATLSPPAANARTGSHSDGRRTSILFADFHVEAVNVSELVDITATAKYQWSMD